jgi:CobW/HypB/UreG, nucleotide-binding domain
LDSRFSFLTGFLGAGKTTLLNRILTGDHGLRVAVLVNDFGSINIDAELVVGVESEGDVINLANGCVCCNIRDDLVAAVTQVMTRAERPEYILLDRGAIFRSVLASRAGEGPRGRVGSGAEPDGSGDRRGISPVGIDRSPRRCSGRCPGGPAQMRESLGAHGGFFDGGDDLQDAQGSCRACLF